MVSRTRFQSVLPTESGNRKTTHDATEVGNRADGHGPSVDSHRQVKNAKSTRDCWQRRNHARRRQYPRKLTIRIDITTGSRGVVMSDGAAVDNIDNANSASGWQVRNLRGFTCTNNQRSAILRGPAANLNRLLTACNQRGPRLTNRQTFANHDSSHASEVLTATHLTTTEKWAVQFRPGRFLLSTIPHAESMARYKNG